MLLLLLQADNTQWSYCRPRKARGPRRRATSPGSDMEPGADYGAEDEEHDEDADAAAAVLEADIAQLQVSFLQTH